MATYLLDTSTFSCMMREHPQVRARIASLAPTDRLVICTIVRGEVLYGLERLPRGKRRRDLETKAATLFATLLCEPIPEGAADAYARVKRSAERKGTPLDENDLWIAATATALEAVKELLQQLAVIGREFPLSLIRRVVTRSEEELYRLLSALRRKEFLYEQPAFPEVEYIFKHALTQEVAYKKRLPCQERVDAGRGAL